MSLPTLSQQPRWLLLSIFLVLWSWSTSLRRDGGRTKALGLGVDARAFTWEVKRQLVVGLPLCAQACAVQSQVAIGCGDSLNFPCTCHSEQFMPGAVNCMTTNCTQTDKEAGEATLNTACKAVGTSVSLPTSFSTGTSSITSGVPPISGSATTTITESTTGSSTSETDSPSSAPASSTASQPSVTVTQTTTAPPSSTTVSSTSISSETSSHTESTIIATSTAGNPSAGGSGNGSVIMTGGVSISGIMLAVLLATVGAVVSL